eukprot:COSAG02_NODE_28591_length_586_cov_2.420945_1_plen_95_part_10
MTFCHACGRAPTPAVWIAKWRGHSKPFVRCGAQSCRNSSAVEQALCLCSLVGRHSATRVRGRPGKHVGEISAKVRQLVLGDDSSEYIEAQLPHRA